MLQKSGFLRDVIRQELHEFSCVSEKWVSYDVM